MVGAAARRPADAVQGLPLRRAPRARMYAHRSPSCARPQAAILTGETHEHVQDLLLLDVTPLRWVLPQGRRCSLRWPGRGS